MLLLADMAVRNLVRSPVVALAMAGVACGAIAIALSTGEAPAAPVVVAAPAPPPPPAPHVDHGSALPDLEKPVLRGLDVTVAAADRGAALNLSLQLHLGPPTSSSDMISIRARCAVDGEWYDGSTSLMVDRLGAGDHTVAERIVVGSRYQLGALPSACHLQLEYFARPIRPAADRVFAVRCWNGRGVVDGRCDAIARAAPLELRDVRVTMTSYLRVELDAELHRELDWWLRIAAECTMPDGTKRSDATSIPLSQTRPGKQFTEHSMLFWQTKLVDAPSACTLRFEVEDIYHLAHQPIAVRCWSNKGKPCET